MFCLGLSRAIINPVAGDPTMHCNGYTQLCDRTYNKVAFSSTHNSFAYFKGNLASNQNKNIAEQLNDGISAFMLDLHSNQKQGFGKLVNSAFQNSDIGSAIGKTIEKITGKTSNTKRSIDSVKNNAEIRMCHTSCVLLDEGTFDNTLKLFKTFLQKNTNEVITIMLENYDSFSAEQIATKFVLAGLMDYIFNPNNHDLKTRWPTLREMINSNSRLVVFTDRNPNTAAVPWLMLQGDYIGETSYEVSSSSKFDCKMNSNNKPLSLLNHFVYTKTKILGIDADTPSSEASTKVNSAENILAQYNLCVQNSKEFVPNFIAVDFYDKGDLINTIATINGVGKTMQHRVNVDTVDSKVKLINSSVSGKTTNVWLSTPIMMLIAILYVYLDYNY
ncbi:hypothetical protein BB558_006351 [Smittium angustum]|uniref:Phosphatidylinositol-specific phospholipase C X domain-containing protein n=1 Tax=Smittium angustum TaxID=133377 RepID=A0A2U1IXZ9_SMIAN|nr:hypothetical protein BB558_006351 [Smittium angustum]